MKYYRRNPGDYLSATRHLTLIQHGAYNVLMDNYYATETALPSDKASLYRIAGALTPPERAAVDFVVGQFFVPDGAALVQDRIEREIAAGREKSQKLSANGSHGGSARARNIEANAIANATANALANAKQKPKHIHQPSTITKANALEKQGADALLVGVDPQVASDWQTLRAKKRAPITATAVDGIRAEALKAGLSLQDALSICCRKGWASFDASWDWRGQGPPTGIVKNSKYADRKAFAESINGHSPAPDHNVIDGTAERLD